MPIVPVFALVFVTILFALFGWVARELAPHFALMQQIALRSVAAALLLAVVYRRALRQHRLGPREHAVAALRALLLGPLSTGLFIAALTTTTVSNVFFLMLLPVSVIEGPLLFGERWSARSAAAGIVAVCGAVMLAAPDLQHIGRGELLAFASALTGGTAIAARKWHRPDLPDTVLGFYQAAYGGLECLALSCISEPWPGSWTPRAAAIIACGALMVAVCAVLLSYGYRRLSVAPAGLIMAMEGVFGVVVGTMIYGEQLERSSVLGGAVILASVLLAVTPMPGGAAAGGAPSPRPMDGRVEKAIALPEASKRACRLG